ncbi:MAG TPA: diaminobutyrate acetyltransferase [Nitrosomonas halophila]|nr:diaminobutyrate acetyltransferase [Nitrosomonas halophila]
MTESKPQDAYLEVKQRSRIVIRQPFSTDGASVNALIASCPPLDQNSLYCNLLQCTHFSATSALAEQDGRVLGFVSGYRLPDEPETLFIWQVAVDPVARGKALGKRLILDILARPVCAGVSMLKTTVTSPNAASRAMFEKIAAALGAPHQRTLLFDRDQHLGGQHDSEFLISIGPFHVSGRVNQTEGKNHDHT